MKRGAIYTISDISLNKVLYVGQTRQNPKVRWEQHRGRHAPLSKHLRAYGIHKLRFEVIENPPLEMLNDREEFWIAEFDTMHPNGLNHRPGGRAKGTSERVKAKLSRINKEVWADPDRREAARIRTKERWKDPEYRARMTASRKAMWADPVFKAKMTEKRRATAARPELRENHAEKMRKKWADPEYKAKLRDKIKAGHAAGGVDEEERAARSARAKAIWADPERRARMSAAISAAKRRVDVFA